MADLFSGKNAPLSRAFAMLGWRVFTVDRCRDASQDLSDPAFQRAVRARLGEAAFIAAVPGYTSSRTASPSPVVTHVRRHGRCWLPRHCMPLQAQAAANGIEAHG